MNSSAPRSHPRRLGLLAALASFPFLASLSLADYQLDNDVAWGDIRLSYPSVIVNRFTVLAGQETITGVEILFDGYQTSGQPLNLVVYSDPNNDSIFSDAVLIYSQAGFLPEVPTTDPQRFHFVTGITFNPGDVFYIGYEQLAETSYNVRLDSSYPGGGARTWFSFGGLSPTDPTDGGTTTTFAAQGIYQNAMIRALAPSAIPEPASASTLAGAAILIGTGLRRRRRG